MGKVEIKPNSLGLPMCCVVVSCYEEKHGGNMITLGYCAVVNGQPPMIGISVRPSRYSYSLIKEAGDFVVNVPTDEQVVTADLAGLVSGKSVDKFDLTRCKKAQAKVVKSPLIEEFPLNFECKLLDTVELPSHTLFIGEVVAMHADDVLLNPDKTLNWEGAPFLLFWNRVYFAMGKQIAGFGFSKKSDK